MTTEEQNLRIVAEARKEERLACARIADNVATVLSARAAVSESSQDIFGWRLAWREAQTIAQKIRNRRED